MGNTGDLYRDNTLKGYREMEYASSGGGEAKTNETQDVQHGQRMEQGTRTAGPKAAEDSRTPRRCRDQLRPTPSARSWSAIDLCPFEFRSLAGGTLWAVEIRLLTPAATRRGIFPSKRLSHP